MICTALRKKGTNEFYWNITDRQWVVMDYPELMDKDTTIESVKYYYRHFRPLPEDAELIKVEVKIIEDEN